jgi:hypothetical protein
VLAAGPDQHAQGEGVEVGVVGTLVGWGVVLALVVWGTLTARASH